MICCLCKGKYDSRKFKPFKVKVFQQQSKFFSKQKLCYSC